MAPEVIYQRISRTKPSVKAPTQTKTKVKVCIDAKKGIYKRISK